MASSDGKNSKQVVAAAPKVNMALKKSK